MPRLCFALDLIDDPQLIAAYEKFHQPGQVWAEIIDDIRAEGYRSMQIWRAHDRLLMVAETEENFPLGTRGVAMTEIFDRWQAAMGKFQRRIPQAQADQKWVPMDCIFDLDAHSGSGSPDSPAIRQS